MEERNKNDGINGKHIETMESTERKNKSKKRKKMIEKVMEINKN